VDKFGKQFSQTNGLVGVIA